MLSCVQSWMSANKLKLNPDRTELIVFENKKQHAELASFLSTDIFGNKQSPPVIVKNLTVRFFSCLNMSQQVSDVTKTYNYHI